MKKIISKLLLLTMMVTMAFGLTACGKTSYDTVADYINSDAAQSQLKTLTDEMAGTGIDIKVSAEESKLIYTYTYADMENFDGLAEQLEAAMSQQDSTFQELADEVGKLVDTKPVSVVIEYLDSNKELIYSKEYTAK